MASSGGGGGSGGKPVKKNAFVLFCEEKRMELEAKGMKVPGGMRDMLAMGAPYWEKLSAKERATFSEKAKLLRQNPDLVRASSYAGSGSDVDSRVVKKHESLEEKLVRVLGKETNDEGEIRDSLFQQPARDEEQPGPQNRKFLFLHFGTYVATALHILPAEYCIAEFNVESGLGEVYWGLMDPVKIPMGYRSDVMDSMNRYGYNLPGYNTVFDLYSDCCQYIERLVKKNTAVEGQPVTLFTMPDDLEVVSRCLEHLVEKTGTNLNIKLKSIHTLMQVLLTEGDVIQRKNDTKWKVFADRKYSIMRYFENLDLMFGDELACDHHRQEERVDKMPACSKQKVQTWVYNVLKYICPLFGVVPLVDKHYPKCSFGVEQGRRLVVPVGEKPQSTVSEPLKTISDRPSDLTGPEAAVEVAGRTQSEEVINTASRVDTVVVESEVETLSAEKKPGHTSNGFEVKEVDHELGQPEVKGVDPELGQPEAKAVDHELGQPEVRGVEEDDVWGDCEPKKEADDKSGGCEQKEQVDESSGQGRGRGRFWEEKKDVQFGLRVGSKPKSKHSIVQPEAAEHLESVPKSSHFKQAALKADNRPGQAQSSLTRSTSTRTPNLPPPEVGEENYMDAGTAEEGEGVARGKGSGRGRSSQTAEAGRVVAGTEDQSGGE